MFAIGIDIGGTNTRIGLVKENGALIKIKEILTDLSLPPELFLKILAHECAPFLKEATSVGICIAGQTEKGYLHFAPNINWRAIEIGNFFCKLVDRPVTVENDVRAALIAESICGAGKASSNLLMLSLGTGLGGAILSNRTLITGQRGSAGEIGHICIDFNGRECTCGGRGCLEAYVGGWAIRKQSGGLSPENVFAQAKKGNVDCQKIVNEVIVALGAGVGTLVNLLNPEKIIYSGGILQAHPEIIKPIQEQVRKRALEVATEHLEWKRGELEYPGVIGSALASFDIAIGEQSC